MIVHLMLLVLAMSVGCSSNAGGGGTTHVGPKVSEIGVPIELKLSFVSTGESKGVLSERFTNILCHFQLHKSNLFHQVPAQVKYDSTKSMEVVFLIPTSDYKVGDTIEYDFSFNFDGRSNKRAGGTVLIK